MERCVCVGASVAHPRDSVVNISVRRLCEDFPYQHKVSAKFPMVCNYMQMQMQDI